MKITLSLILLSALSFSGDYTNSIGMKFKDIPAGSFTMGTSTPNCPKNSPFYDLKEDDKCLVNISIREIPEHRVKVNSFYLGETEVTQGQWYAVMGYNPSKYKTGDENMPVENVSWDDAQHFIERLNSSEGTSKYALPSEEQWEYAARAGTTTKWHCGDSESCVRSIAVYDGVNSLSPVSAKSKKPNGWGLYDMSGNVWEWVNGCWTPNYNSAPDCSSRTTRGGAWNTYVNSTRSATRGKSAPDERVSYVGFRVLMNK